MKKIFLVAFFINSSFALFGQKVFQADTPEGAQVKIALEMDASKCDYKFFTVFTPEEANKVGLWFMVDNAADADVIVFWVDDASQADLLVGMGVDESDIGWVKEDKKSLIPWEP